MVEVFSLTAHMLVGESLEHANYEEFRFQLSILTKDARSQAHHEVIRVEAIYSLYDLVSRIV